MGTALARNGNGHSPAEIMESVIARGDLAKLLPDERASYYTAVCRSVGLNPLTQPFAYITLNGKLTLYALRNCTDQLRSIHRISVVDMTENEREGVCIVTCKVQNAEGRTDMAKGAVNVAGLKAEALANAIMKAETKAKRRATLSICGLGLLDETEVEDIPANVKRPNPHTNRAEDIVDVPALDDPDRIPAPSEAITELPKMQQRPIADKLGKELAGFASLENLERWKNLPETAARLATIRHEWREIFQGRVKERLMELRSAQKMAAAPVAPHSDAPDEPEAFLKWVDAQLATVTDPGMLDPTWEFQIEPHLPKFLPPDQEEAMGVYRKHERRLS